jgi:branched-subunit amino acid permease
MGMEVLSAITEIFRDLLIFVAVMTALLIALVVVVSKLPNDNPLKRVLMALSYRVGATAAAGAIAIPIEPIPGLDTLYDIGVPILLLLYWISFFRNAGRMMSEPPSAPGHKQIEHEGR